jgi:hypothetical protein
VRQAVRDDDRILPNKLSSTIGELFVGFIDPMAKILHPREVRDQPLMHLIEAVTIRAKRIPAYL